MMFICEPHQQWVVDCDRWQRKEAESRSLSLQQTLRKPDYPWHCLSGVVKEGIISEAVSCLKNTLYLTLSRKWKGWILDIQDWQSHEDWTHHSRDRAKFEAMGMRQHGSSQPQAGCHQPRRIGTGTRKLNVDQDEVHLLQVWRENSNIV